MAIHRCSRRHYRDPPLRTSRYPFKGSLHVCSPQINRRLCIYLPLSVSKTQPPRPPSNTDLNSSLIIFSLLHISALHTALKQTDMTLASVEPTVWMQVELHYALVACSVFCLRPFMAAVSTNYGTAGDSTLESSASRSRKEDSKSGSGSGSNENSRTISRMAGSRSHSRVQRKRAGTAPMVPASGSGEVKNSNQSRGDVLSGKNILDGDAEGDINNTTLDRIPMRTSMFPLGARKSLPKIDKAKHVVQGNCATDSDLIELVPRPYSRHERGASAQTHTPDDEDRMVIRKEVRYSIQYEDEGPRRVEGKALDVSAYI
jgi:hypothetical protein